MRHIALKLRDVKTDWASGLLTSGEGSGKN